MSGIIAVARSAFVLVVVLVLVLAGGVREGWIRVPRFAWLPVPFVLYSGISLTWGDINAWPVIGSIITAWIGAIAVAVVLANVGKWRSLEFGMVLSTGVNVVALYVGFDVRETLGLAMSTERVGSLVFTRASGLIGNANGLAAAMIGMALIAWAFRERFSTFGSWVLLAGAVVTAQLSASRLGVMLLVGVVLIVGARVRSTRARIALGVISVVVAVAYAKVGNDLLFAVGDRVPVVARMLEIQTGREASFVVHESLIWVGWSAFLDRPIEGYGLASFGSATHTDIGYAHNNWIELAVNGGVLGIACYYWMHAWVLRAWLENRRLQQSVGWLLILTLIASEVAWVSYFDRVYALVLACMCATVQSPGWSCGRDCWQTSSLELTARLGDVA